MFREGKDVNPDRHALDEPKLTAKQFSLSLVCWKLIDNGLCGRVCRVSCHTIRHDTNQGFLKVHHREDDYYKRVAEASIYSIASWESSRFHSQTFRIEPESNVHSKFYDLPYVTTIGH
ncbi:hypothetical protein TNCV_3081801 [Trichonephila clavipes]|nr:hypothetical protein TNCV_3081801 [Trichonephila clavipes]